MGAMLKDKVLAIVRELYNPSETKVKQTNVTLRGKNWRDQYYFVCEDFVSTYTMKRFVEIYEKKEYDSFKVENLQWYWLKNREVVG
jgi:hypothetical protein